MRPDAASLGSRPIVHKAEQLLRRLGESEDESIRTVLALRPGATGECDLALTPRVLTLVRLAALVAGDASTTSLR